MKFKSYVAFAVVAAFFAGVSAAWAQPSGHRMISPKDLKWGDVPSLPPGAKIAVIEGPMSEAVPFTVRLKFPANYKIPAHWHPAVERVTVISGTFNMGVGDKLDTQKSMPLRPGSMMILQPKIRGKGGSICARSGCSESYNGGVSGRDAPSCAFVWPVSRTLADVVLSASWDLRAHHWGADHRYFPGIAFRGRGGQKGKPHPSPQGAMQSVPPPTKSSRWSRSTHPPSRAACDASPDCRRVMTDGRSRRPGRVVHPA